MTNQSTIFEMLYPTYKINKPIRLISLFSGYDSQALALKYLGVKYEHYKTCEWAVKSIQALKDLHFEDNTDYSQDLTTEEIKEFLFKKGISSNYNDPMTKQQVNRLGEKQVRTIYNNIKATHNLVNIQQVKGKDLDIKDTEKYCYIMTYSFPCQDLSLAGNRKGMSDTSTRSGMLWEVERILGELEERPQVLLMENVPQVHGEGAIEDFNKWQLRLEELGYKNYWQDLIATDYGIPQTRNRCFMVSILGNYNYTFPKPMPLKLKLKDMLEDEVDEKYFLSDAMMNCFMSDGTGNYPRKERFLQNINRKNQDIGNTITSRAGDRPTDNFVMCKTLRETLETNEIPDGVNMIDGYNRNIRNDELSGSITTRIDASNNTYLAIKNATKKGYLEAEVGDGIDISSRMEYHRGTVQKDKTQTLSTMGGENNGVVVKKMGDYSTSNYVVKGIATNESKECQKEPLEEKSRTLLANKSNAGVGCIDTNLRIRKLTPKECFRLMGVKDEDFEKVKKNQSDSSLYHLAGDSIVVNVLMAIFKEML